MHGLRLPFLAVMALALTPQCAAAQDDLCRLCSKSDDAAKSNEPARQEIPLTIEITANLDFSRAAIAASGSGGRIEVDPDNGGRAVKGGLVDLGGYANAGTALLRGEPGRPVRIDLPPSVRMTSSTGGVIEITGLRTNLSGVPQLDSNGQLSFSFGGRIEVHGDMTGMFRGRIPITANYE